MTTATARFPGPASSRALGLLVAIVLLASSCGTGQPTAQVSIEQLMPTIGQPNNGWCDAPGGVLLIDGPNGRRLTAAGVADLETLRPIDGSDRFEVGSITKSFTVVLALQLQEQGVLSLDDRLSKWLPEQAALLPFGDEITLRELAANRAGVWDYADPLIDSALSSDDEAALARRYEPSEIVDLVVQYGAPVFKSGTDYAYSSSNFILLGMVIEAATGQALVDVFADRIFGPAGMSDTTYPMSPPAPGSIVDGYYPTRGRMVDVTGWNPTQGGAAGAIISTATDMGSYVMALAHGTLLNDESLQQMFALPVPDSDYFSGTIGYGLGVMLYGNSKVEGVGHGGQTPGFSTVWLYVFEADTVVVFLTNSATCDAVFDLTSLLTDDMFTKR